MPALFYKPGALRTIKKFNLQELSVYKSELHFLKEIPESGRFLKGSLKGLRKWKYKVGSVPYRIVYVLEDDVITIIAVGKRKDFYELLS